MPQPTILVTGATGQLGRLVVADLLRTQPADSIIATGRSEQSLESFRAQGIHTRLADYTKPDTLRAAFTGVDRLLLISSSEFGQRAAQHRNAILAAKEAGVKLIVYTSILHADTSELILAAEHRETEETLRASGVPFALLRNGWYSENFTNAVHQALATGSFAGASASGRFSAATRADYAAAAVAVLTAPTVKSGSVYELAGDESFTQQELAAAIEKQAGKAVHYADLAEGEYSAILVGVGLPAPIAGMLAQSDAAASRGALFDDSMTLRTLIGRATTPLPVWIASLLALQLAAEPA